jgi:hypothetical protein
MHTDPAFCIAEYSSTQLEEIACVVKELEVSELKPTEINQAVMKSFSKNHGHLPSCTCLLSEKSRSDFQALGFQVAEKDFNSLSAQVIETVTEGTDDFGCDDIVRQEF